MGTEVTVTLNKRLAGFFGGEGFILRSSMEMGWPFFMLAELSLRRS